MKTNGIIYSVYYLVGGYSNFICKPITGLFSFENAQIEVDRLNKQGYKAASVKNGNIIGGLCDWDDFETEQQRKEYFNNINGFSFKKH